jgi:hypothetical protein
VNDKDPFMYQQFKDSFFDHSDPSRQPTEYDWLKGWGCLWRDAICAERDRGTPPEHVHQWQEIGDRCGPMVTHECKCGIAIALPPDDHRWRGNISDPAHNPLWDSQQASEEAVK